MRQLHLNLVKFAPHWINALILNLVKTGGCAGPFDHTGEGGHHPLFHGSCPKDPLWVGNPNILEPFILPRFFGLLDPSVCWGRIRLRDVACRAGNSVFWLGAQDSQFFWLPKCVNCKVIKLRRKCLNLWALGAKTTVSLRVCFSIYALRPGVKKLASSLSLLSSSFIWILNIFWIICPRSPFFGSQSPVPEI